ncbi:MAG: (E)-4-hydroxy-3-methylbut-2-enyl-diphosphate synthase, partial [Muribaculaceae bacterium]|nr:(E)-4-hydroxy-3-methylbut-2-enyl-diphosphate synthase [Muribaculaceae bacterium]
MGVFDYQRRRSSVVEIGNTPLGGDNPVRIQSMTSTSTMDTEGSARQACLIAEAGGEYVRLTAQGVREAVNLAEIKKAMLTSGVNVPLVADIHFNPKAAFAAAETVEKVRINPGNFVDPGRTFKKLEFTDEEYRLELERIERELLPFIELCRRNRTAVRIGVNHGSLSDRIMSRYGDTPSGMVESAMEFLRVFVKHDFKNVVVSMKASNTVVMVESVRRLVEAMNHEEMSFPLHLGVTEAGDGEDGRIKSAVGIGTLLAEGIGDTVRVSLSEAPEAEIPVARYLVNHFEKRTEAPLIHGSYAARYNPTVPERMPTVSHSNIGGSMPVAVIVEAHELNADYEGSRRPDMALSPSWLRINAGDIVDVESLRDDASPIVVKSNHINVTGEIQAFLHRLMDTGIERPIIVELTYDNLDKEQVVISAAADFGTLLLNGFCDGIVLNANRLSPNERVDIAFGILQASRRRFTKTEFISCPGCGRTMFDLQSTVREIKA